MKKIDILNKIASSLVVAVIRAKSTEEALKISNACIEGGIKAIEVTFTVDYAHEVIKGLSHEYKTQDVLIGAGTVLDSQTARLAILNGASFIVSPAFDLETAKLCHRYQVPYLPGCQTITEMIKAMEAGCDIIKLFPGNLGGPSYVKTIKGPLPFINLMPTGGVSLENIQEWIKAGCVAVGVGGELTRPAQDNHFEIVTENAKAFLKAAKKAKENQ
jgi:2-dehydro-3-deoxyphosphogluconate aldolase/(4S)-4-hydroxy-2-oxoglutarate aldolase